MKKLKIQQEMQFNLAIPKPLIVSLDGTVGDEKLIGVCEEPENIIHLTLAEVWLRPDLIVGMYPIFQRSNGESYVSKLAIEDAEVVYV